MALKQWQKIYRKLRPESLWARLALWLSGSSTLKNKPKLELSFNMAIMALADVKSLA